MLLKQRVWTVRDTALQENKKIEELIGVCAKSKTKLSSIEEQLKSLIRQQEEYDWEFQYNLLQEYIDKACNTNNPPLYIGKSRAEFSKYILLGNQVEQHESSIEQHQHSRFAYIHPSTSMDWREIMSWHSIDSLILWRILISKGLMQLQPFGEGSDGRLKWYHNP